MKLKEISIKKLFGYIDTGIDFDNDIKIIFGKNGTGKTTILRIIDIIFNGQLEKLGGIVFQKIELKFSSGDILSIEKLNKNGTPAVKSDQYRKEHFSIKLKEKNKSEVKAFYNLNTKDNIKMNYIYSEGLEDYYVERIRKLENLDCFEDLDHFGIFDKYDNHHIEARKNKISLRKPAENKIMKFLKDYRVKFIETQRLLAHKSVRSLKSKNNLKRLALGGERISNERSGNTISKYADDLKLTIDELFSESLLIGQKLDSTFPNRLLNINKILYDEEKILKLVDKWEIIRNKLENIGIITSADVLNIKEAIMDEFQQKVMFLYLSDSLEKYKVFEELEKKLSLYIKIINEKLGGHKRLVPSKEKGFEVVTKNGETLLLDHLSSGEQHELVLFYDLIFNAVDNRVILIDEPELSLHIDWQMSFIDDLKSVSNLVSSQFIIATHSPSIIGHRIKLCTEIGAE